jgi:transposase-like protein
MSILSKEQIRNLIATSNITTVDDIIATLKDMFKDVLQEMLEAELDDHLGYGKYNLSEKETTNSRNGYSKKNVKTEFGNVDIDVPRDRNSEFKPQIIPKHKRDISGLEQKIISLYARGMSTRDIHDQIKELYEIEISAEMVSNITNKILPKINDWQSRPLDKMYTFVFMDAIHYKVREDNHIVSKAAYVVLGVNQDGFKEVLAIYIGENKTSKFWLSVLNGLKNRGVEDVMVFCVDGLNGFKQAIEATYPNAQVQRCIIHQIRTSLKFVPYKDRKKFAADLRTIYTAPTEEDGLNALISVKDKWEKKYPYSIKSWENNWDTLSTFFAYPKDIRKIIYTTNVIESLNRQYRKVTKNKGVFPSDDSLMKMLYLATGNITKKWTRRYDNWDLVMNQLSIIYGDRITKYVS